MWGPHVSSCVVLLRSDAETEREIEMSRIDGQEELWGVELLGLPSVEDLEKGKVQYQFVLESTWNDCFHSEGQRLYRRT